MDQYDFLFSDSLTWAASCQQGDGKPTTPWLEDHCCCLLCHRLLRNRELKILWVFSTCSIGIFCFVFCHIISVDQWDVNVNYSNRHWCDSFSCHLILLFLFFNTWRRKDVLKKNTEVKCISFEYTGPSLNFQKIFSKIYLENFIYNNLLM